MYRVLSVSHPSSRPTSTEAKNQTKQALEERRKEDADNWEERLGVLNAAQGWQMRHVTKGCVSDLQKNYKILSSAKLDVSIIHKVAFTRRLAAECMRVQNVTGWLDKIWPFAGDAQAWTAATPTFAALFCEYTVEDGGQTQDDLDELMNAWQDTVVGDEWLLAMEDPIGIFRTTIVEYMKRAHSTTQTSPAWFKSIWEVTTRAVRGFAVLLLPTPVPFGGNDDDVTFIRDIGSNGTINDTTVKVKKSLIKKLKKDPWIAIVDAYEAVKGPAEVHGPKMVSLEETVLDSAYKANLDATHALVSNI